MSKIVEVKLWGKTVGFLGFPKGSNITTFEYSDEFMTSNIFISPITMKYPPKIHFFDDISQRTFKGLAGVFADSLPDKFGSQLIDQFMAQKGKTKDDITSLDRLLYVGNKGMGALEYYPLELDDTPMGSLDISLLSQLSDMVLEKKEILNSTIAKAHQREVAFNLIKIGSSAGGARAKAVVAKKVDGKLYDGTHIYKDETDTSYWLLKFDSSNNSDRDKKDPKGMTKVEYIYSLIVKDCDIDMPETDYISQDGDFHFLIKRFDRIFIKERDKYEKLHYISWCGLMHAHRETTAQ